MLSTQFVLVALVLAVVGLYFWATVLQLRSGDDAEYMRATADQWREFMEEWFEALQKYREEVKERLDDEEAKHILDMISLIQQDLTKLHSNYRSLKGTVARMHRKDPADLVAANDDDAGPGDDDISRIREKKRLRDEAKKKGYLR